MNANRRFFPVYGLLLFVTLLFATRTPAAQSARTSLEGITLLQATGAGVTFAVTPPPPVRHSTLVNASEYETVAMVGYGRLGETGRPDLPQTGVLVALPPGAEPRLRLLDSRQHLLEDIRVAPAVEQVIASFNAADPASVPEFTSRGAPDPAIYAADTPYPAETVVLGRITSIRDQRVVQVLIRPVQVRPASRTALIHTALTVAVDFHFPNGPPSAASAVDFHFPNGPLSAASVADLHFPNGTLSAAAAPRAESPVFETFLADAILNGAQAPSWRRPPASRAAQASPCLDDNAFRLTVTETGIHEVTFAELAAAGFDEAVDEDKLRMCRGDAEIAFAVQNNDASGLFGSSDAIRFYGEAIKTQETTNNIYWLTYGNAGAPDGLRMGNTTVPGGSSTLVADYEYPIRVEEDNVYISRFPSADTSDHWYWGDIADGIPGSPSELNIPFDVPDLATPHQVSLSFEAYGHLAVRRHVVEILVNDTSVGTVDFIDSGFNPAHVLTTTFSSDELESGANTMTLRAINNGAVPTQTHIVWIDRVELAPRRDFTALNDEIHFTEPAAGNWMYEIDSFSAQPLVLDVTDPAAPRKVAGVSGTTTVTFAQDTSGAASYALAAPAAFRQVAAIVRDAAPYAGGPTLQDGDQQADYIIITDPLYTSQLAPLVALRQGQGLTVKTVFVQDIFDEFSYGVYDPAAIQRFLAYAYSNWQAPAPSYVLLAGDGSYDHRDLTGANGAYGNRVPVFLRSGVDSNIGETATDNQYVDFNGDDLADMMLGRLPAQTLVQMSAMVDRIVTYETTTELQQWHARHLFVADNGYELPEPCTIDPAGDFFLTVNTFLAEHFPVLRQNYDRLFYAPLPCYPESKPYYRRTPDEMEADIVAAFDEGRQFVIYTGHSGSTFWAKDGSNGFFNVNVVQNNLVNGDRTPIMLPMTCLEGSYHRPATTSLSEALLRKPSSGALAGGAVASFAPTGLQVQQGHDFLITGFYDGVFNDDYDLLGMGVMSAKLNLFSNTVMFQDLQDTFMLLGDPAMDMRVWRPDHLMFLPWNGRQ